MSRAQFLVYAHRGVMFGFFSTESPYGISECRALKDRAHKLSSPEVGNITVRLIEYPEHPNEQGYAVLTDKRGVKRKQFEALMPKLFPRCKLDIGGWISRFEQDGGRLFGALVFREAMRGRHRAGPAAIPPGICGRSSQQKRYTRHAKVCSIRPLL